MKVKKSSNVLVLDLEDLTIDTIMWIYDELRNAKSGINQKAFLKLEEYGEKNDIRLNPFTEV